MAEISIFKGLFSQTRKGTISVLRPAARNLLATYSAVA